MIMTLSEILFSRRSCRKFKSEVPSREVLDRLLKAAFTAPSSKNTRSTRYIVVSNPAVMAHLSQMRDSGAAFLKDTPVGIIVCGDTAVTDLWRENCSISATILQLAAEELGLGSCWVHVNGRPHSKQDSSLGTAADYVRKTIAIPEGWEPECIVAVGYPDGELHPHSEKDDSDKVIFL